MARLMLLYTLLLAIALLKSTVNGDPDETRTSIQIIESRGFTVEEHLVNTDDGYILTLHRIVHPYLKGPKKPVLLQHGLIATSSCFLINSPGEPMLPEGKLGNQSVGNNLGFELANRGYDVWLGNTRGSAYSRGHTVLKQSNPEFWAFTITEMSEYDIPAFVDYILQKTNYSSIGYVGHSQGTAVLFALLSERPEFTDKIKPFIAIAPVTTLTHTKSPIVHIADNYLFTLLLRQKAEFFVNREISRWISRYACKTGGDFMKTVCRNFIFAVVGYNPEQTNATRLPVYMHHIPGGASNWNVLHFLQINLRKQFAKFDYGITENLRHYGQDSPPEFKLENIKSKHIALIYSENDLLADIEDVNLLKNRLQVPLIADYLIPNRHWNHLDFLFGTEAGFYVNSKVLSLLQKF